MMFVYDVLSRQEPAKILGKVTVDQMCSDKALNLAAQFYKDLLKVQFRETLHVQVPKYKKFNR